MGEPPKKDYPPGWNDPPMLSYNPSNPPPKSRITNKRVAFPLGASSPNNVQPSQASNIQPLPPISGSPCIENLYLKSSENFRKCVETLNNENIKTQIWQMLSAWHSGKFSENVQNLLTELSINIIEGNKIEVNEIHLRLAMNPAVKIYLPALNYLINPSGKS